jgi:hypothetical protein
MEALRKLINTLHLVPVVAQCVLLANILRPQPRNVLYVPRAHTKTKLANLRAKTIAMPVIILQVIKRPVPNATQAHTNPVLTNQVAKTIV